MLLEAASLVARNALLAPDVLASQSEELCVPGASGHEARITLPGRVVDGVCPALSGAEEDLVGPVVYGDRVLLVLPDRQ